MNCNTTHYRANSSSVPGDPTVSLLELSDSVKQRYATQAQPCNLNFLLRALSLISKTDVSYKSAKNQRLLVEMALMQLTFLNGAADPEKKKDEPDNTFGAQPVKNSEIHALSQKMNALNEPGVKFSATPRVVDIEQLIKTRSAFSLNESTKFLQRSPTDQAVTPNNVPLVVEAPEPKFSNKEVDLDLIKSFIAAYVTEKQRQGARQTATIFSTAGISFSDNTVTLVLNNETQKEQLLGIKQEFIDELRTSLQNNTILLEIGITKTEIQSKAYKPIDIFKAMSEKNPSLLDLKKRFDLEIDY